MTPLDQASAILKAAEEASDGPWRNMPTPNRRSIIAESGTIAVLSFPDDCKHAENAAFIALARNTAPAIALALIEKHRALEEALGLIEAHFKTLWEDDLMVANDCGWTHAYCGRCEEDGGSELGKAATWKDVPHSDKCVYAPARALLARQGATA